MAGRSRTLIWQVTAAKVVREKLIDQDVFVIDFQDQPIASWCLALCLLREELIDSIALGDGIAPSPLVFKRAPTSSHLEQSAFVSDGGRVSVEVSDNDLKWWLNWFLKYFRDGYADVDHIDVELRPLGEGDAGIDLTFTVAAYAPALSHEEARRRLGLSSKQWAKAVKKGA
jgi:hypothetical protein